MERDGVLVEKKWREARGVSVFIWKARRDKQLSCVIKMWGQKINSSSFSEVQFERNIVKYHKKLFFCKGFVTFLFI